MILRARCGAFPTARGTCCAIAKRAPTGGKLEHDYMGSWNIRDIFSKKAKMILMKMLKIFLISILVTSCERVAMDKDYPLFLKNQSNHSVRTIINQGGKFGLHYPDTSLPEVSDRISIEILPGSKNAVAGGDVTWAQIFASQFPLDTLSFFVLHSDTVSKFIWNDIKSDYKILKRYDVSLTDLEKLNYTLTYPPDSTMRGIKMYPK